MTENEIRKRVWRDVDKAGDQRTVAAKIGVSDSYLSEFLGGKRPPNKRVQKYLGIERRVTYQKLKTNGASNGR